MASLVPRPIPSFLMLHATLGMGLGGKANHGNIPLKKGVSIATNVCINTSGCNGQVAMEFLYLRLDVKGFYGNKVAI